MNNACTEGVWAAPAVPPIPVWVTPVLVRLCLLWSDIEVLLALGDAEGGISSRGSERKRTGGTAAATSPYHGSSSELKTNSEQRPVLSLPPLRPVVPKLTVAAMPCPTAGVELGSWK